MNVVVLRDYQGSAVAAVRQAFMAGHRRMLLVVPTGGGKTVIFAWVAAATRTNGKRVLILVHRKELIRQASEKLTAAGVPHGIIAPGFRPNDEAVQVASVQTLARRLADPRYPTPHLIVVDEAHHAVAGQWAMVLEAYPEAMVLGVTATPERADGRGLGRVAGGPFDTMVMGPTVTDLIELGFLTPARVFAPPEAPDLTGVATIGGDYSARALASAMSGTKIVGDAVAHYAKHAAGLPAISFSPSVAHAEETARAFRANGWRAVAASGDTEPEERDAAITGLGTGAVQVLCSCDLVSEGLDVPAVGAVILLRPTQSTGLYLQQVGRGLRPAPGKQHLIVLDHAGNTLVHGLPDAPREWSLGGRKKRPGRAVSTCQCPSCFAIHAPRPKCPECGHAYGGAEPEIEQVVPGELEEVDAARMKRLAALPFEDAVREAVTFNQLAEVGRARGYKAGWAWHMYNERQRAQQTGVAA